MHLSGFPLGTVACDVIWVIVYIPFIVLKTQKMGMRYNERFKGCSSIIKEAGFMGNLLNGEVFRNYFLTLVVFLAIDMIWLLLLAKKLYSEQLGYLMAKNPNLIAALVFYLLFIAGLLFFVIQPALASGSGQYALLAGMFFGLVTYGTYDLTNLSTIRDWPVLITAVDLAWGSIATGSTAWISFNLISRF